MGMGTRRIAAAGALAGALAAGTAGARALPAVAGHADDCDASTRRYEVHCLMPRIESRLQLGEDGDVVGFVERMRDIDQTCVEVTASGLARCVAWPRVRPSGEYRRWLRDLRETWERRQVERDGTRPACPPGALNCL
jgi:hypothetical protein